MSGNPLAEAGARRRAETEGRWLARWQIAAYEGLLASAIVGSAWLDLWLSQFMIGADSAIFDALRAAEDMGNSKWFLVPAGCWLLAALLLRRLLGGADWKARMDWLIRAQVWLIAAVAVSGIAANVFKWIFGRARPRFLEEGMAADWTLLNRDWGFQSYPSGHATTLFAAAFVLAALFPRLKWFIWGAAVAGGLGRIAIGAHYLSDVIAGALLGGVTAWWLASYLGRRGLRPGGWPG